MGRRRAPSCALLPLLAAVAGTDSAFHILDPADYEQHFTSLPEVGGITGAAAFSWAVEQLPFADLGTSAPDEADKLTAAYYYRAKVLREHILDTGYPDAPFAVSECKFATTVENATTHTAVNGTVGCTWGDKFGVINAASGHHIAEGSWLRGSKYMDSYLRYFYQPVHTADGKVAKTQSPRAYSSWQVTAALKKFRVDRNISFVATLLPAFADNFVQWVKDHRLDRAGLPGGACRGANVDPAAGGDWWATCPDNGQPPCFWISDGWDAMEASVSGTGCRPSIGAMMYGEAAATAELASLVAAASPSTYNRSAIDAAAVAEKMTAVAADIRKNYLELLWNEKIEHFAVYKADAKNHSADVPPPPLPPPARHPKTDPRAGWACDAPYMSYWGYRDIVSADTFSRFVRAAF
eukprot:SAG22_NODE_1795_length_3553_cov_5.156051_1_plen_408_part_00